MDWYVVGEYKFKFDFSDDKFYVANDHFMLKVDFDDFIDYYVTSEFVVESLTKMLDNRIKNLEVLR